MDKDRAKGAANQAMITAGKPLGDDKLKAEGAGDKAKGKSESAAGDLRDVARDAANH